MSTKKKSPAERAAEIKALEARLAAAKEADKRATAAEEAKARAETYKQLEAAAKRAGLDVAAFIAEAERAIAAIGRYGSIYNKEYEQAINYLETVQPKY